MDMFNDEPGSPAADKLPIPDDDHLPKRIVEGHVSSLVREELEAVLHYGSAERERPLSSTRSTPAAAGCSPLLVTARWVPAGLQPQV
jgi:hypothetical protein